MLTYIAFFDISKFTYFPSPKNYRSHLHMPGYATGSAQRKWESQ